MGTQAGGVAPGQCVTEIPAGCKDILPEIGLGDHLCWFYELEMHRREMLTRFLRQGLAREERVVYIADAASGSRVLRYLMDEDEAVEGHVQSGQLKVYEMADAEKRRRPSGPDAAKAILEDELDRALSDGYRGLRVCQEMSWVLGAGPVSSEHLLEYEAALHELISQSRCLCMCAYEVRCFDLAVLLDVLSTHPFCAVGTEILPNPYCVAPSQILGPDRDAAKMRYLIESLAEHTRVQEEKRQEAKLRKGHSLEALSTLAGGIAHNFNNLLMAIQGNTSMMIVGTDSDHPHHEMLRNIERQVKNGSRLVDGLLGYAREGKRELKPLELNRLIQKTFETFGGAKEGIRVHQKLDAGLSGIIGDQKQIEEVLLNLYINAAEAMPFGGDLYLETRNVTHKEMRGRPYEPTPGSYVMFTLQDTGVGIDKETMERIFEPFYTTKDFGEGTGLGLAFAYGIIKGHGGYMDVYSLIHQGTTFRIYLPSADTFTAVQGLPGERPVPVGRDRHMVLDVDEPMISN